MEALHLILGCHLVDRETMQTILNGLEAHENLFMFYLNESFDGPVQESFSSVLQRPVIDLWHGFITKELRHSVVCGLLESARWRFPQDVNIVIQDAVRDLSAYTVLQYRQAIDRQEF